MVIFFRASKKVKILKFIGWFCLKDKLLGQKTDTAVYCPHNEGLWKISTKSKSWQGVLSIIYLHFLREKERGVRGVIMAAFCCYKNIFKLKTQEPQARFKWKLPDICATLPPFISKKMRTSMIGRWGAHLKFHQKLPRNLHKMSTLTSSKSSLRNAIKTGFFSTVILNYLNLFLLWREGREGL